MKVAFYKFINARKIKRVLAEYKNEKRTARIFLDKVNYMNIHGVNRYNWENYNKHWSLYRKHYSRMCELIGEYNSLTHICESGLYPSKLLNCYNI